MTKVMKCNCVHEAQDKIYGQNNRLFNEAGGDKGSKYRCTVCGKLVENKTIKPVNESSK